MKNIKYLIAVLMMFTGIVMAQNTLEENVEKQDNGFVVKYKIKNHQTKHHRRKGDYERYVVEVSIVNKTGKTIGYRINKKDATDFLDLYNDKTKLITFNCSNATGIRMTSEDVILNLNEHKLAYTYYKKDKEKKTDYITAGYYFDNNTKISDEVIFITPKGEKPQVDYELED